MVAKSKVKPLCLTARIVKTPKLLTKK